MLVKNNKARANEQADRARDLPPWFARNERDNEHMARWLNERLDEIQKWLDVNLLDENRLDDICEEFLENGKEGGPELTEARHGNIEPLRKRYPKLAEYIHLPKQPGKGKRFQKSKWKAREEIFDDPSKNKMTRAAWDVATIRDLWGRCYGKKKRSNPAAEDFAAERHKVDVDALCVWMRSRQLPKDLNRQKIRNYVFGVKS